jgi:tetratricopeptide (TPR) repeat protein
VQALKHLAEAGGADPASVNTTAALLFKAGVLEKLERRAEAREVYREALKKAPDNSDALAGCVRLALATDDRAEALAYLRRYTVAAGEDGDRLATAADFYLRLGRDDDAFDLASEAARRRPGARAQRVLGLVLDRRGEYEQAISHLEKGELDARALEALVRGHLALGKLHAAEQSAQRLDKVEKPTAALVQVCLHVNALALRRASLLKEAKAPAGKAAVLADAIDRFLCADHAHVQGRPPAQVEALLAGAFVGGAELGPAHALRGLLALERGRLTRALTDAERAVALSPREARGFYVRGRVRLERGSPEALADLEKAAALTDRKDAAGLHWLALALFQANRFQDALAAQQLAVKLKPKEREFAEQLERFEKQLPAGGGS